MALDSTIEVEGGTGTELLYSIMDRTVSNEHTVFVRKFTRRTHPGHFEKYSPYCSLCVSLQKLFGSEPHLEVCY